jgi:chemotaxis protein MotB
MIEEPPAKEKKVAEELTCPEWMMTMGDCMSLLLTFFVLLLTFSTTSKAKLMDVIGVMKGAFSFIKVEMISDETAYNPNSFDEDGLKVINPPGSSELRLTANEVQRWKKIIENRVEEMGFKFNIELNQADQGFEVIIPIEDIFFKETYDLTIKGKELLNELGAIATSRANEIRIVSYVDKASVNRRFNAAWKLSMEQNLALLRTLRDTFNIKESQFSTSVKVIKGSTLSQEFSKIKVIFMEKLSVNEMELSKFLNDSN